MHQVLTREGEGIDLAAMIVWVEMLPADEHADVAALAVRLGDRRVAWFHDPNRRAGEAIGRALGGEGSLAWDVYLFYGADVEWGDDPPTPDGWAHQLTDDWADPARRRQGQDLELELAALLRAVARKEPPT